MENIFKIIASPFTPNLETVDGLVVQLGLPHAEQSVSVKINPNIQQYIENNDQSQMQVRQATLTTGTDETLIFNFDLVNENTHKFTLANKKYELKILQISEEEIEGQTFKSFEFFLVSQN